jgi:hypothetical protein
MDAHRLYKLAKTYEEILDAQTSTLINSLLNWPGGGVAPPTTPSPPSAAPPTVGGPPSGYRRMTGVPSQAIQDKASQILRKVRGEPYGTSIPFELGGTEYIAVLEQHAPRPGGRSDYHPGITVYVKQDQTSAARVGRAQDTDRTRAKLAELDPVFRPQVEELLRRARAAGLRPEIVEAYRTHARQKELYEQGRSQPGHKVTNAKPGRSAHNHRLAVDIAALDENNSIYYPKGEDLFYQTMGRIAHDLGIMWGGDWANLKDFAHFQYRP